MVTPGAVDLELAAASASCLAPITIAVPRGQRVALLGRNGAGKSTLLRLAAGLVSPSRGTARTAGPIGWMAQDVRASLLPWLDVAHNIALPLRPLRLSTAEVARRVNAVLEVVPIAPALLVRKPDELSGGEQQRVLLARALAGRPRTLLLDEPFSALDTAGRLDLRRRLVATLAREDITVLFTTHDLDDVLALADRAIVLAGVPARVAGDIEIDPDDAPRARQHLERACAEAA